MSKLLQSRELYEFGAFRLDTAERALTRNGQIVPLTPKAFDTLVVLLQHSGHVVEKDVLLKEVWPDTFVEEGVLAVNVAAIRKALSDGDEGQSYIETMPRRGYRFVGEVRASRNIPETGIAADELRLPRESRLRLWRLVAGLLALILAGFGWFVSRSRPSSTPAASPPIPLTSYPGVEVSPTFSPDGSQVAFTWNGPQQDNFDIYPKVVDRDDFVRLTRDPAEDSRPAWSPDGRRIAFVRAGTVFVISPMGGPETKVADLQAGEIEWTKDGKSLVVSAGLIGEFHLLLLSVETGRTKELTSPSRKGFEFGDRTFAISPDGLKLAFARFHSTSAADLYLLPLAGGEPIQLTQNERSILGITWTSDGRELVYASDRATSNQTLWRRSVEAPVDSPSRRVESAGPNAGQPVIRKVASGSQDRLAYPTVIVDCNIWTRDTEESPSPARKVIASSKDEAQPQFSPDGKRIAFSSDRSGITQIYVADRDGSSVLPLTSFSAGFTNAPRWSPDGKRIVFASLHNNNRELYTVSPDGGSLRQLTRAPSNEGRPSWSRDGRWIYFYSDRSGQESIWRIPAEGGEMIQVTKGRGHESFESPNGKLLYYEDFAVKGLQSIPTERTAWPMEGTVVLPSVRPGYWAVAEKGIYYLTSDHRNALAYRMYRGFATSSVSYRVMFYDFRTRKEAQIGAIGKAVGSFSVTWDGRTIVWSQVDNAEADIMMIENFR